MRLRINPVSGAVEVIEIVEARPRGEPALLKQDRP
jgi:hypothetical protein